VDDAAKPAVLAARSGDTEGTAIRWKTAGGIPVLLHTLPPPSGPAAHDTAGLRLHLDLARLGLLRGFDQLLCLEGLTGVEHLPHQIETVRKVLRHFRGRVLLADEVGLGKTIEAALLLREYLLRGLARRVLILVPTPLVSQWQEELRSKFHLDFDVPPRTRQSDRADYWAGADRVLASISFAKSQRRAAAVAAAPWDLVIVDEAHHCKNRATKNWQLINSLSRRHLFLLTATPVQNSLLELYNLLTLLEPGHLKTESDFKKQYVRRGNPRDPRNRERLRSLLGQVMVRNTRSLVSINLPPRYAQTMMAQPHGAEETLYRRLNEYLRRRKALPGNSEAEESAVDEAAADCDAVDCDAVQRGLSSPPAGAAAHDLSSSPAGDALVQRSLFDVPESPPPSVPEIDARENTVSSNAVFSNAVPGKASSDLPPLGRIQLSALLTASGSHPRALAKTLEKVAGDDPQAVDIIDAAKGIERSAKDAMLLELLGQSRNDKVLIFANFLQTLQHLQTLLAEAGIAYTTFSGAESDRQKDDAVAAFREQVHVMLCSESGGEGRNLQFANTLVNYDLPWNPMKIEQRVGRVHRIGQTREVFIFNLCTAGTLEAQLLDLLTEKIRMFELVVGEVGSILGNLDGGEEFETLVLNLWLKSHNDQELASSFDALGNSLVDAQEKYLDSKQLDEALFGEDYE
jgi:SNF2 family DNA or RNA helicase